MKPIAMINLYVEALLKLLSSIFSTSVAGEHVVNSCFFCVSEEQKNLSTSAIARV